MKYREGACGRRRMPHGAKGKGIKESEQSEILSTDPVHAPDGVWRWGEVCGRGERMTVLTMRPWSDQTDCSGNNVDHSL